MPTLQAENMADMVTATLRNLGRGKITDLTTDLREFVALPNLLNKNRLVFGSGYGTRWQLVMDNNHSARHVPLFSRDDAGAGDALKFAVMNWRHIENSYAFDEHEMDMNQGEAQIVDLIKTRKMEADMSGAELMETDFWSCPPVTDELAPHGVPYHVVKNNTEGFNGGHATPFVGAAYTDWAGLSRTTYPRLKNWTAQYAQVSKDDLIRKMRKAAYNVNFKSPLKPLPIPDYNTGNSYGYYTTYDVVSQMEEILEDQNENLGNDVASKDGMVLFRRVEVMAVPKLDLDLTNPIYGINWGIFKTAILKPWWMKVKKIDTTPGQHNVCTVFEDTTLEWQCTNPRLNFVIAKDVTMYF